MNQEIVIVAAKRTPIGALLGGLKSLSATELAVRAHLACIEEINLDKNLINAAIMGCVLPAGLGQAPARQTAIKAGLSTHTVATTVNKVCGSGMQALIYAHDSILNQRHQIIIAGGMESMSQAPYMLPKARQGYRLGHGECLDHMWWDGLQDAYDPKRHLMGYFGELAAEKLGFSREAQDAFAKNSMEKALQAQQNGAFHAEWASLDELAEDEQPKAEKIEKLSKLKPVFSEHGTITAGNASSIADGAASLILMTHEKAKNLGLKPLAKIVGFSQYAQDPQWFTTAPQYAIESLLKTLNWQTQEVDLWEINEAFAVVAMAAIQYLKLDPKRVNIHGGACALGHPIGASGARIVVTLIHALKQQQLTKGIASMCIGGGEALAMAVECL